MEWTWKSIGPDNFHISFVTLFLTFATSVWISAARLLWTSAGSRGSASLPVATESATNRQTPGSFAEMQSIRPRSGSNQRLLCL